LGEPAPDRTSVDDLVVRLRAQGVDRLLADPVASARVARASEGSVSTLVANGVVDNHGAAPLQWLARPIRLHARDGILVPIEELPELRQRLEAAGTRHLVEPLRDHALVRVVAPLASTSPCRPPASRRSAAQPASDGSGAPATLEAGLGEETLVSGIRLRYSAGPASTVPVVQVGVSHDGNAWHPVAGARAVPEWGWAGRTLFAAAAGLLEVVLDPTPARHVRVAVGSPVADLRLVCVRGAQRAGSR
jgi:hypothetical protein